MALILIPSAFGPLVPVLRRSKGSASWYDLPGGKRYADEDPFDAIAREIEEEIGVRAAVDGFLCAAPHPAFCDRSRYYFTARYLDGTPANCQPAEHDGLLLLPPMMAIIQLGNRIPELAQHYLIRRGMCRAGAALNP